jgi:hypothetical protein
MMKYPGAGVLGSTISAEEAWLLTEPVLLLLNPELDRLLRLLTSLPPGWRLSPSSSPGLSSIPLLVLCPFSGSVAIPPGSSLRRLLVKASGRLAGN